jgi:hypothetical protein
MDFSPIQSVNTESSTSKHSPALSEMSDHADQQISSSLQMFTTNLLNSAVFADDPTGSSSNQDRTSRLAMRSCSLRKRVTPRNAILDDEASIFELARKLHSMVLYVIKDANLDLDDEQDVEEETGGSPIVVLPQEMSSLEELLEGSGGYMEEVLDDETSSCGSSLDSLKYYRARQKKATAATE